MKSIIPYIVSFAVGIIATNVWNQFYGQGESPTTTEKSVYVARPVADSPLVSASDQSVQAGLSQSCQSEVSLDAIRSIIRAEIKRADSDGIEAVTSSEQETFETVTMEQVEAFDDSLAIIEESISARVWDSDMRDQFQNLLNQVNPGQREELILSVIQAVNNGEIVPQTDGPFM